MSVVHREVVNIESETLEYIKKFKTKNKKSTSSACHLTLF